MRILQANKYHYIQGGAERYYLDLSRRLTAERFTACRITGVIACLVGLFDMAFGTVIILGSFDRFAVRPQARILAGHDRICFPGCRGLANQPRQ